MLSSAHGDAMKKEKKIAWLPERGNFDESLNDSTIPYRNVRFISVKEIKVSQSEHQVIQIVFDVDGKEVEKLTTPPSLLWNIMESEKNATYVPVDDNKILQP